VSRCSEGTDFPAVRSWSQEHQGHRASRIPTGTLVGLGSALYCQCRVTPEFGTHEDQCGERSERTSSSKQDRETLDPHFAVAQTTASPALFVGEFGDLTTNYGELLNGLLVRAGSRGVENTFRRIESGAERRRPST
jgi:hypothetical protein